MDVTQATRYSYGEAVNECFRVYEWKVDVMDYNPTMLFESEYMLFAHSFAYDAWMKSKKEKIFVVLQKNGIMRASSGGKNRSRLWSILR